MAITYRRIEPDIKEATLIRDLINKHAGDQIVELSQDRDFQAIFELTATQQRWADLVDTLTAEAELEGQLDEMATRPAPAMPAPDAPPQRKRPRGGDADTTPTE
jgi:hypothetical protein